MYRRWQMVWIFFIDSLYYIHTYIGDTAQNSSLIYVCTTTKKNYPKKLDKTAKIARDYAENAPKALVIYRFRTTTNSESSIVYYNEQRSIFCSPLKFSPAIVIPFFCSTNCPKMHYEHQIC